MRRRFNLGERVALYLAAAGRCSDCGAPLDAGWHADHVRAFSAGGSTDLLNGQALCPRCNQQKGSRALAMLDLRRWQGDWREAGKQSVEKGLRIIVADSYPGSGKTTATLIEMNDLFQQGLIDGAQVFVPRINLCKQYEEDWARLRPQLSGPVMGDLVVRDNNPPLIRGGAFGYISTYASAVAKPRLHLEITQNRRSCLIVDESQILGVDEDEATRAASVMEEIGALAAFIRSVSGTTGRSDGRRLLFARYTEPDLNGYYRLIADVQASYLDGVREGYLRPFEAILSDGQALREYLDGDEEELRLGEMSAGVSHVLKQPGFWKPMVDQWVEKVREVQRIDRRLCGLIGACDQDHAKAVIRYLDETHHLKVLLAVSSEMAAQGNLDAFRKGGYDGLVTVGMAHVGYDHKPITVVLCLNSIRQDSWLDQFAGRGMRMMLDLAMEDQFLWWLCPDDPRMRSWVDAKRYESEKALRVRVPGPPPPPPPPPRIALVGDGRIGAQSGMGMAPENDLEPDLWQPVDGVRRRYRLGNVPHTNLWAAIRDSGGTLEEVRRAGKTEAAGAAQATATEKEYVNIREQEAILRKRVNGLCQKRDGAMRRPDERAGREPRWPWGTSGAEVKKAFSKAIIQMSIEELGQALIWIAKEWGLRDE